MYEFEAWFNKMVQGFINWFTKFFTTVAVYLLIIIIIIVFLIVAILIIRALIDRNRFKNRRNE